MNTADKSIDAIDYAIRRRFIFIDSPADRNVVMLYVKEFGNLTKSNATIDNEYVGKFIDELRKEFSY